VEKSYLRIIQVLSFFLVLSIFAPITTSQAIDIGTGGGLWSTSLVIPEHGTPPISGEAISPQGLHDVSVSGCLDGTRSWRIDIAKVERGSLTGSYHLYARRLGPGIPADNPPGSISGGSAWVEVTEANKAFFAGSGNYSAIAIQYKVLAPLSVSPGDYSISLVFTIVENN
jgi:hypothetical protein